MEIINDRHKKRGTVEIVLSTKEPLILSEVKTEAEFAEVIKLQDLAFGIPLMDTSSNVLNTDTVFEWSEHMTAEGHHWLKVTYGDLIVGAAKWVIIKEGGFRRYYNLDETPKGDLKTRSEPILFDSDRPSITLKVKHPRLELDHCFVHPDYRRRGIGSLLMQWGCKVADNLDLEIFVEATDDGVELYKGHGFLVIQTTGFTSPNLGSDRFWDMWRPRGGQFEEGKIVFSWDS